MAPTSVVTAILSIIVLSSSLETVAEECPRSTVSGCRSACKEIFVTKFDGNGRNCSGPVKIWGCGGLCLSYSVPHWNFPYKKPYHRVCIHDRREWSEAIIPYCEPGAAEGTNKYRYLRAEGCKCSGCDSSDTSCEGLHKREEPSTFAVDETDQLMEILRPPAKQPVRRWQEFIAQILQPPVYP